MKNSIVALLVGFIFAIGLGVAGMTQPAKVVGFLDVFGSWDPSLMFVMVGAIAVHFLTYKLIRKRTKPVFDIKWHVPTSQEITPALMVGAFLFGIGWGLGGLCPGPAITALASFEVRPFLFILSMVAGMYLYRLVDKKLKIKK